MEQTTIENLTIFYSNLAELNALTKEVFTDEEYRATLKTPEPLIIDCGSHIGLSILYFKKHYPQAKIISFEPDPTNFEILQKNIVANKLTGVSLVNAALTAQNGPVILYSSDKRTSENDWSWGNTISYDLRPGNVQKTVPGTKLSSYLKNHVDLIKMDIEGAELEVLQEIEPQLGGVDQIILEYHGLPNAKANKLSDVLKILRRNFLNVSVFGEKETNDWRWEIFKKNGFPLFRIKNPYNLIIKASKDQVLEKVPCPLCQGPKPSSLGFFEDNQLRLSKRYELLKCINCRFSYLNLNPTPKDLENFYPGNYLPHQTDYPLKYYHQEALKFVTSQAGKVLDIGCANGVFLREMKKRNWEVFGVETNQSAAESCQSSFGRDHIFASPLTKLNLLPNSFDLITLFQVLEHLPDPKKHLELCYQLLKKDGLLIIDVQNYSSPEAKIFGPNWYGLDIPRHLSQFRKSDLLSLIQQYGFAKVVKFKTIGHYFTEKHQSWIKHSIDIFYAKQRKLLEENYKDSPFYWPQRFFLKVEYRSLILLGFPLHYFQRLTNNNGEMFIVVQK